MLGIATVVRSSCGGPTPRRCSSSGWWARIWRTSSSVAPARPRLRRLRRLRASDRGRRSASTSPWCPGCLWAAPGELDALEEAYSRRCADELCPVAETAMENGRRSGGGGHLGVQLGGGDVGVPEHRL